MQSSKQKSMNTSEKEELGIKNIVTPYTIHDNLIIKIHVKGLKILLNTNKLFLQS